ncbi:DUF4129 domain-containing protein [Actinokineospora sp.]|uniref:DUF4129 domain-containing protein n=1 Tax=Actinokineospora sp. TaxID=1872133 RepID=UPI0040379667
MRSRLPALLVVAALLVLAVVAARGESAIPKGSALGPRPDPPESTPGDTGIGDGTRNPILDLISGISTGILLLLIVAMLLIGLAGILAALAGIGRRRRLLLPVPTLEHADGVEPSSGVTVRDLFVAARRARHELSRRAGGPPADAIVAAWLVLEDAAAAHGVRRAAHQTPTEFTGDVLAAHAVDGVALGELRRLYQRARFGEPGAVTDADAEAARDALLRVEGSLAAA